MKLQKNPFNDAYSFDEIWARPSYLGDAYSRNEYVSRVPDINNPNQYNINRLPEVLQRAVFEFHDISQFPIEMIASTALASLSLALQPLIDVASPFGSGKPEPCSLYYLILAKSGEGKSPVREFFMQTFNDFAEGMHEEYQKKLIEYKHDHDIWAAKKLSLNTSYRKAVRHGGDGDVEELMLREHLNKEPLSPREFEMFYEDSTPEGIIQGLMTYPYAGVFSDEAITFFNGHLKNNLALFNKIWKNEPLSLSRKKEGNIRLIAHLTFLLMVQPDIFDEYLDKHGKKAISSGFLARFLFTTTESSIGKRRVSLIQDKPQPNINTLFEKIKGYLEQQKSIFYGDVREKETLRLSDDARRYYEEKTNEYQQYIGENGSHEHIAESISKAGSNALRLSAIFSYLTNPGEVISRAWLENAFVITEWNLFQADKYFYTLSKKYRLHQDVYLLFGWIKRRINDTKGQITITNHNNGGLSYIDREPLNPFLKKELLTHGPGRLRNAQRINAALDELINLGLIVIINYPPSNESYIAMYNKNEWPHSYMASYLGDECGVINSPPGYNIKKQKRNLTISPSDYDFTQLQWDD